MTRLWRWRVMAAMRVNVFLFGVLASAGAAAVVACGGGGSSTNPAESEGGPDASLDGAEEAMTRDGGGDASIADGGRTDTNPDDGLDAEADAQPDAPQEASPPCMVDASSPYLVDAIDLAATTLGPGAACVVRQDGSVACWEMWSRAPTTVVFPADAGAPPMTHVAVSYATGCSLDTNGGVWCWGQDDSGQLGNGAPVDGDTHKVPTRVVDATLRPIKAVGLAAGGDHHCATTAEGPVLCWGEITEGTAPADAGIYSNVALPVPGLSLPGWKPVAGPFSWGAGSTYQAALCAVSPAGDQIACWGYDTYSECLGPCPSAQVESALVEAGATAPVEGVSVGSEHVCALDHRGQVFCWGTNSFDELGTTAGGQLPPTLVSSLADAGVIQVSAAGFETCVIDSARHLRCFGSNMSEQLGIGNTDAGLLTATPTLVVDLDGGGALTAVTQIVAPCAIVQGFCGPEGPGSVVCWSALDPSGVNSAVPVLMTAP